MSMFLFLTFVCIFFLLVASWNVVFYYPCVAPSGNARPQLYRVPSDAAQVSFLHEIQLLYKE